MNTAIMIYTVSGRKEYNPFDYWAQGIDREFFCNDLTIKNMIHLVSESFGIPIDRIFWVTSNGRLSRREEYAFCRQVIHYLAVEKMGYGKSEIGRITGGVDHSTVIHSISAINNLMESKYIDTKGKRTKRLIETIAFYCEINPNSNNIAQL